jgi:Zn-finger nucleic acid-binding protein
VGDDVIQECPACRGLWFVKGQLDSIKDEVLPETGWVDVDRLKEQFDYKARTENPLYCPQCRDIALTRVEDQKTKTAFRFCTQCVGTWLSTGQFLKFINLLLDDSGCTRSFLACRRPMITNSDADFSSISSNSRLINFKSILSLLKHRVFIENPKLRSVIVGLEKTLPL